MSQFNNEEYRVLVSDLIGDVYYTSTSYRGKISTLRQYAEVVIRKILDIDPKQEITLGDKEIRQGIQTLPNHKIVETAVKKLKKKVIKPHTPSIVEKLQLMNLTLQQMACLIFWPTFS